MTILDYLGLECAQLKQRESMIVFEAHAVHCSSMLARTHKVFMFQLTVL